MQAFNTIKSRIIPLPVKDVDTDMIIPAQYLTQTSREGYGQYLFQRLKSMDPDFVFNKPQYQDCQILVSGENFGCGSSREHAAWAFFQAGIRVIIAESFSDIFFNNSTKNGLLLITLPKEIIQKIIQDDSEITVDLQNQVVVADQKYNFDYDSFRKTCLLNGYDDLDYLLNAMNKIDEFEEKKNA